MPGLKRTQLPMVTPDLRLYDKDLSRSLNDLIVNLSVLLDGGLRFVDNMSVELVTLVSSGTPDAENTVAHGLKRVPTGYIIVGLDKAAIVYNGSAPTTTTLPLKVNVATVTAKILVF
jgi:heptaprenylglyceryl phosphate synthase